jgi:hypothetical protein
MPTIEVPVPAYTTFEVDLSDHLSEIDVDIDEDVIRQAIDSGQLDSEEILSAIEDSVVVSYIDDGNVEIPDATLLKLIEGRDDLVKLSLSGVEDLTVAEQAQQLYDRLFTAGGTNEATRTIRLLVRHLCRDAPFRGAVTDALGEHYVKAPLESLVPVQIEDAEVAAEAAN